MPVKLPVEFIKGGLALDGELNLLLFVDDADGELVYFSLF
jgi:hypothetical protein